MPDTDLAPLLTRLADALERLAPPAPPKNDLDGADAFIWHAEGDWLEPVREVNRVQVPGTANDQAINDTMTKIRILNPCGRA